MVSGYVSTWESCDVLRINPDIATITDHRLKSISPCASLVNYTAELLQLIYRLASSGLRYKAYQCLQGNMTYLRRIGSHLARSGEIATYQYGHQQFCLRPQYATFHLLASIRLDSFSVLMVNLDKKRVMVIIYLFVHSQHSDQRTHYPHGLPQHQVRRADAPEC